MTSRFEPTTVEHPESESGTTDAPLSRRVLTMRQLEPAVAGTIAAATGWLAGTEHTDLPLLWLFCLLAVAIACWAVWRRAVAQPEIAARALALLAAGYLLHTWGGAPGGPIGVFFFWLGLTTLYYVFALTAPFASLVAVAAVAEFILATMWAGDDALASLAARGVSLLILPMLLAMKLGSLWRRNAARTEKGCTDPSTALYSRSGLLMHGKELLQTCRAERGELTLAVFDCADLLEARTVYGNRTSRRLVDGIVRKLTLLAGRQGLAARTGPTQFAIAMPMSRDKAVQAIERALGNPTRFELEDCKSEIVLVPHLMVEAIPAAGTVERMFAALCRGLVRVQEQERMRQRYLQRERERHSKPMPIQPIRADQPAARPRALRLESGPVLTHQLTNTIPMPLPAR